MSGLDGRAGSGSSSARQVEGSWGVAVAMSSRAGVAGSGLVICWGVGKGKAVGLIVGVTERLMGTRSGSSTCAYGRVGSSGEGCSPAPDLCGDGGSGLFRATWLRGNGWWLGNRECLFKQMHWHGPVWSHVEFPREGRLYPTGKYLCSISLFIFGHERIGALCCWAPVVRKLSHQSATLRVR